jgi:hypothetical protein
LTADARPLVCFGREDEWPLHYRHPAAAGEPVYWRGQVVGTTGEPRQGGAPGWLDLLPGKDLPPELAAGLRQPAAAS